MRIIQSILLFFTGIIVALGLLCWLGLQIQPRSFPAYPDKTPQLKTVPLPAGLPKP